jgi:hypothetical protein
MGYGRVSGSPIGRAVLSNEKEARLDQSVLAHYRHLVEEVLTVPLCVTWIESLPTIDALVTVGQREDGMARRTYAHTVQLCACRKLHPRSSSGM